MDGGNIQAKEAKEKVEYVQTATSSQVDEGTPSLEEFYKDMNDSVAISEQQNNVDNPDNSQRIVLSCTRDEANLPIRKSVGFGRYSGTQYGSGNFSASTGNSYSNKQVSYSSSKTIELTAQETMNEHMSKMDNYAKNGYTFVEFNNLYEYYTKGAVAIDKYGNRAVSPLGTEKQIQELREKAQARAEAILSGKARMAKNDWESDFDKFLVLLPNELRNEFESNKKFIIDNRENSSNSHKKAKVAPTRSKNKPNKLKTWFKGLFAKKDKKADAAVMAESTTNTEVKKDVDKAKTSQENPWYETFEFNAADPKGSIKNWCEKLGEKKLSHEQYQVAKSRIPVEYQKAAAHIGVWYKNTKDRKDFDWNELPANRRVELTKAQAEYTKNMAEKSLGNKNNIASTGMRPSPRALNNVYNNARDGIRQKRDRYIGR